MAQPPVLLTRPRAASDALAGRLRAAGVGHVEVSPLLDIRPVDALPPLAEALILTSPNGIKAYATLGGPPGIAAWCVGPRTAGRAAAHGLQVQGVAEDAHTLAGQIPRDAPPLLHLRGAHQRGDLVGDLRRRGLKATDAVIYDQVALPLTDAAAALVADGPVLTPLYSPRTAVLLAEALPASRHGNIRTVCISKAVVQAAPFDCLAVAARPDGAAMERAILAALGHIGG
ncbi:MAG: uroporphyrinogen-III synthase [Pseudomonadota bacterium]